jgi:hypothetical protein
MSTANSPPSWFKSLDPKMRLGLGAGLIAWGTIGLYLSDTAEKKLGFEPSDEDKEKLKAITPRITIVERE